jgi:hypothetical protein
LRPYDIQARARRIELKRRDGGLDRFLLVVADTKSNRRVLREFSDYFTDLPRLNASTVLDMPRAGRLPPTGLILL